MSPSPEDRLSSANRPGAVNEWCRENSINEPNKVAVAYRILEEGLENTVLDESYREPVKQLFENISTKLQQVSS
jgi:hypothetical protein